MKQMSRSVTTSWGTVIVKTPDSLTLDVNDYMLHDESITVVQITSVLDGRVVSYVRTERCKEIESIIRRIEQGKGTTKVLATGSMEDLPKMFVPNGPIEAMFPGAKFPNESDESFEVNLASRYNPEEDIEKWFTYHPPRPDQFDKYTEINRYTRALAIVIMRNAPAGVEREQALIAVRSARMWANAAIACS